jgi:FkbM family methyltransferase
MVAPMIDPGRYSAMSTRQKKAFWRSNPVRGDITITLPGFPPFMMYSDNDDTVVKELYWTGFSGWERTSLYLWWKIAGGSGPGTVLDVGSYSGIYSLIAGLANGGHRVQALDIQPRCLERVRRNLELNGIANVTTVHAACIDRAGSVPYFFYEEDDVLSSIASIDANAVNDRTAEAPGITIDALLATEAGRNRVVLMKIDVEGAEDRTLLGARETLEADRPDVLIEVNDRRKLGAVRKLFPRGYQCYSIDEHQPRVRRVGLLSAPFDQRNYLFSTRSPGQVAALADWGSSDT